MRIQTVFLLLSLFWPIKTIAQTESIEGKAIDEQLATLPSIVVTNTSTKIQTVTDQKGEYRIAAIKGDTLSFSMIGLTTELIPVDKRSRINVVMGDKQLNCLGAVWSEAKWRKEERRQQKRYNRLHKKAVQQGIFKEDK